MSWSRPIYCTACECDVDAELTDGGEVYPHRPDLAELPFWICRDCGNFVGCHHKTDDPTRPLGHIPTPEIKEARKHIHRILDPLWKGGQMSRSQAYKQISKQLGRRYHTACIRSVEEARQVYRIVLDIRKCAPKK